MNPSPGVPPPLASPPSLPARVGQAVLRKVLTFLVGIGILGLIGYCVSDKKDYPGKAEFETANSLIDSKTKGITHGNSPAAKKAAEVFSKHTKLMQGALFKGGSGLSIASGGEFLTYCRHNSDSVAIIVHVPELRNYKYKTREALATLTWTTANLAAKELTFPGKEPTLIVGLRGFASYGPIWSGKLGGQPEVKTDDLDEKRRIYPFFAPTPAAK